MEKPLVNDYYIDIEKEYYVSTGVIDHKLDDYTEYVYNGNFNLFNTIFCGFINLICPCSRRKKAP